MNAMKKIFLYLLCSVAIGFPMAGCSISAMNKKPSPLPIESLQEHPRRGELIALFGTPVHSEVVNEERTDYFKFVDGYHGATKIRALVYAAAGFFTLGLSEFIFWPLEVNTMIGMEGSAVATYDGNNVTKSLKILDEEGKPWKLDWRTASIPDSNSSEE